MIIDTPFVYFHKNTLNDNIIDRIKQYADSVEQEQGILFKTDKNDDVRKSSLKWIHHNQNSQWIYDTVKSIVDPVNDGLFQFDLTGIDTIQYTQYIKSGDKYDFHADSAPGVQYPTNMVRKLTMVIQMSDENDYEGGSEIGRAHV